MNIKKITCAVALASMAAAASAQVTLNTDRGSFDASGTFAYNSTFDDFGTGFGFPGDPYTRGDVTYASSNNLTVGSATPYSIGGTSTVMSNNYWSPLIATVNASPMYTLLGFDAAVTSGPVDITISTNTASYVFSGLSLATGATGYTFLGFQATGASEYITGFRIDTIGPGYLPGVTNVEVGNSVVPEPETYAMMLAGIGLLGAIARRRQAKV